MWVVEVLPPTWFPSVSNASKTSVMQYWAGATSCHTQFLLGGYSLGHPGVLREPFSSVMNPPQAAAGRERERAQFSGTGSDLEVRVHVI